MKKFTIILMLLLIPSTFAMSGAGLKYNFEYVELTEKSTHCLNYGLYNPYDSDSYLVLNAEGEHAEYQVKSKSVLVPGNTGVDDEIRHDLCFKFPKLVESCEEGLLLSGKAVAKKDAESEGIGTALAVSSPLDIKLTCKDSNFNVMFFIIPFIFMLSMFGFFYIRKASRNKKYNQLYSELMFLHKKISSGNYDQSHVERFNKIRSILLSFK